MSQTQTQTICYVPQAGTTWANQGRQAPVITLTSAPPAYFEPKPNGYPYWGGIGKNDFIYIPAGSATNNQNVASWGDRVSFQRNHIRSALAENLDKACGGFFFEIDTHRALTNAALLSIALRLAAATRGGTYQLIRCSAQATIITFKLRGTPVRAQDMNRIRLSDR